MKYNVGDIVKTTVWSNILYMIVENYQHVSVSQEKHMRYRLKPLHNFDSETSYSHSLADDTFVLVQKGKI